MICNGYCCARVGKTRTSRYTDRHKFWPIILLAQPAELKTAAGVVVWSETVLIKIANQQTQLSSLPPAPPLIPWSAIKTLAWPLPRIFSRGPIFEKSYDELTKNLWKSLTYEKLRMSMWLSKKIYKNVMKTRTKLCKTYEKLTTTLQVSYEDVKFAASDVIRETLCQRLLLVEYFELNMHNWQSEWRFPKNAFEKWLVIFLRKS